MKALKNLIVWLVSSSADPERLGLAAAGILTLGGTYVLSISNTLCGFAVLCTGIDAMWIDSLVHALTIIITAIGALVGGVMTVIGLIRKLNLGRWAHPSA